MKISKEIFDRVINDGWGRDRIAREYGIPDREADEAIYICKYMNGSDKKQDNGVRKALIISDTHAPDHDVRAVAAVCEYISFYKPNILIHVGDVGHFESVSHWLQDNRRRLETMRVAKDIDDTVELLNVFSSNVTNEVEKIILKGNHDAWVDQYVDKYPTVEGKIDIDAEYRKAGWRVIPMNQPYQLGKLLVLHGMFCNKYHAFSTVHAYSKSVLYGHTHDHQVYTESFFDGEKMAMSIGCLCDLNPEYLKNRPNRWVHGFATVDLDTNGDFFVDFIKIVRGKFIRNGRIFRG